MEYRKTLIQNGCVLYPAIHQSKMCKRWVEEDKWRRDFSQSKREKAPGVGVGRSSRSRLGEASWAVYLHSDVHVVLCTPHMSRQQGAGSGISLFSAVTDERDCEQAFRCTAAPQTPHSSFYMSMQTADMHTGQTQLLTLTSRQLEPKAACVTVESFLHLIFTEKMNE